MELNKHSTPGEVMTYHPKMAEYENKTLTPHPPGHLETAARNQISYQSVDMNDSVLGRSGLKVSRLALGAAQLGNPNLEESLVEKVLNSVLDLGINFIDTAAMYGKSEARIGKHIAHRKDAFTIATKCGVYWSESAGERQLVQDYSPQAFFKPLSAADKD